MVLLVRIGGDSIGVYLVRMGDVFDRGTLDSRRIYIALVRFWFLILVLLHLTCFKGNRTPSKYFLL